MTVTLPTETEKRRAAVVEIDTSPPTSAESSRSIDRINHAVAREWIADGRTTAIATLVETAGSAPLEAAAMMLIDAEGRVEGSVTGGCVEGAIVSEAEQVLTGGEPRVKTFGIADDLGAEVGLMCGGTVHIFIEKLDAQPARVLHAVFSATLGGEAAAVATLVDGPSAGSRMAVVGDTSLGGLDRGRLLDRNVEREMRSMLNHGATALRRFGADGSTVGDELRVHIQSFVEPPAMVIFGAIDFSVALATLATPLGYRVTIVDAREKFLRAGRYADIAEVIVDWPDRYLASRPLGQRDAVLVFTHDPKFDEPALIAAVRSDAGYVGALGSRKTQRDRVNRLREAGLQDEEIARIAAPCGLDIGASSPAETAVSILAEVIATQNARRGEPLSEVTGAIHAAREESAVIGYEPRPAANGQPR
ncbi:MAG TPA: XdhC family protein [Gaiellaceae bacterium]|nr:XdhC family protein [Gaiellaceae bacterium]